MNKKYPDNYIFPAIIEKCPENYSVYFPDLPGIAASGDTVAQSIEMAKEALQLHLWGMEQDSETIPKASEPEEITLENNELLCYIDVNMLPIRYKMDNRSIKKTLTIPWYLNDLAEKKRINFSQLLQEALKQKLQIAQ